MAAKKSESKKSDDTVKEGDMIYLDYEAYMKDKDLLFETTKDELAREHDIFDEKLTYAPVPLTVGKGSVFEGLEEALIGVKVGEDKEVEIPPEKAAGPWDKEKMEIFMLQCGLVLLAPNLYLSEKGKLCVNIFLSLFLLS